MNSNKLPLYLSIAVVFGVFIGMALGSTPADMLSFSKTSNQEQKIKRLINFIEKDYVDKVSTDSLLDGAITQILGKLDPHSVYIPKRNLQAIQENMQGKFVGIGVQFRVIKDTITVIKPIENGPSIKAGIQAGDRLLMANKDTLFGKGFKTSDVPKYLKGKPNTTVNLKVYRKRTDSTFTVTVKRGNVSIKSVDLAYKITDSIGYIKLDRFARTTYKEFKTALDTLNKNGINSLIVDLRGNGGGFIDIADKIIDEFLKDGALIVFTKDNKGDTENHYATKKGSFENRRLYVLIDENSASASEILAGAVQDNDRGTIIGRRSFGKGLVQIEMPLGDGSAVRLTTARYYTPTGRSIQKPYKGKNRYNYRSLDERILNGELLYKDSIKVVDSLQFKTPAGKIVYGGGGIVPDVFVPIDTTVFRSNAFLYNAINSFSFDYIDANRAQVNTWQLDTFLQGFDENETIYKALLKYLNLKKAPNKKTDQGIKDYLKQSFANTLFGIEGYYRVLHKTDNMLLKVMELETTQE